jgi:NAD+ kinase
MITILLSFLAGRARVRSNIQNVLIITKARDNRLIQLTRDLALYLMLKPRHGQDRGLVVYVPRLHARVLLIVS